MDKFGDITKFVALQRDVTKELEIESQLRQAQKMEAIGTLAGGIAHDFNNILTPIMGYTDMLLGSAKTGSEEHGYLTVIRSGATRAKELVAQILQFSRKSTSKPQPIQLTAITKEVLKLLHSTLPKTISIISDIDPNPHHVLADPTQFHTVLMNLCVNANHAMPNGGNLTVSLKNAALESYRIKADVKLSGSFVRLSVQDTGVGMDKETRTRIFEPFFTTKEIGSGTGRSGNSGWQTEKIKKTGPFPQGKGCAQEAEGGRYGSRHRRCCPRAGEGGSRGQPLQDRRGRQALQYQYRGRRLTE